MLYVKRIHPSKAPGMSLNMHSLQNVGTLTEADNESCQKFQVLCGTKLLHCNKDVDKNLPWRFHRGNHMFSPWQSHEKLQKTFVSSQTLGLTTRRASESAGNPV